MTPDDFRELALSMDGAVEQAHMGHPDFRANGRIFATLHADDEWGTVKLIPEEQQELVRQNPAMFVPAAGAWGNKGYTNVRLAAAEVAAVRGAIVLAWEGTARALRGRRRGVRETSRIAPARKRKS